MRILLALVAGFGTLTSFCAQAADPISNAKAAEFALHRIERLVILHKIDATFQTRFERMDLAMQTPQQPSDPTFVIRSSQVAGADGTSMVVVLSFDQLGRPMNHTVGTGAPSLNPPAWPDKDAVTIAENALHWLLEQGPVVDELRSYNLGMSTLVLSPVTDHRGTLNGAEVAIVVAKDKPTLLISMGLDGVFKSYSIFPPVR